jgi:hypothetical protein
MSASEQFTWTVTNPGPDFINENTDPLVEDAYAFSVAEGAPVGSPVGTAPADDPDNDTPLTYSIIGGNDKDLFTIDSASGAITVAQSPDDANGDLGVHQLSIQVIDGEGGVDTGTVTITVVDGNEPPSGNDLPNRSGEDAQAIAGVNLSGYFKDGDEPPDTLSFASTTAPPSWGVGCTRSR